VRRRATRHPVIASQRIGAKRRPMTGSAKQFGVRRAGWIASSQELRAMTGESTAHFLCGAQGLSESQILDAYRGSREYHGDYVTHYNT